MTYLNSLLHNLCYLHYNFTGFLPKLSEDTDVNTHEQNILKDSIDLVYRAYKSMCDNNNLSPYLNPYRNRRQIDNSQNPLFYDRNNNCTADPKPEERTYGNKLVGSLKNQSFYGKTGLVKFDPYGRRVNFTVRFLTSFPVEGVTSWQTIYESLVYRPYSWFLIRENELFFSF